ncbi:hypothetical protein HOO65_030452 [Ceratocystis lukuohia]|uniref:Uncharacterized protein n=1 Tax=Ceratocystis lukuohia TaxID=2019550 RepID=A0ABR4ML29_9PEZI
MKISSFLPFSLPFSCFRGCTPTSVDTYQPAEANGLDAGQSFTPQTSAAIPYMVSSHVYQKSDSHGTGIIDESELYIQDGRNLVIQLSIDAKEKVTTIYKNKLHNDEINAENIKLHELVQSLCIQWMIDFTIMEWAVMDVHEGATRKAIQDYRKGKELHPLDKIRITPDRPEWHIFSDTPHYKDAISMAPGEIDRILIRSRERETGDPCQPLAYDEIIMFSYKKPVWMNGNTVMPPIYEHEAELATDDDTLSTTSEDITGV